MTSRSVVLMTVVKGAMATCHLLYRVDDASRCSAAEYQRMVAEKAKAMMQTTVVLTKPGVAKRKTTASKAIAPWHRAVVANTKRLRKR